MDCDVEAAVLDELGALLHLPGAPDAPAGGGGGGGGEGGDPGGVLGTSRVGGIAVVVVIIKVVDVDVGSGESDCIVVRSIIGVVIGGTEEVS
ncbi:hypothetical protein Tco_1423819 [Tanacetum coccineum]